MKESFVASRAARNRPKVVDMTDQITDSIGGYLMGMVILAFCNSIVATTLHLVLGLPSPSDGRRRVPHHADPAHRIGAVLDRRVDAGALHEPLSALIFAIIYLIYIQLEAYVLTPRVMSRAVSVPGALVVIGALVGGPCWDSSAHSSPSRSPRRSC